MLDVVIIGSGPAGLSAGIYANRANLDSVIIEKEYMGTGQIADSSRVDNYLGIPGVDGYSLGEAFRNHAENLGVSIKEGEVTSIERHNEVWKVYTDADELYETKTIIYTAGCKHRSLGVEGEEKFFGKGISHCAVCDGAFYKGKTVAVIGGGDTALDDALYLSDICEKVYLIHRRDEFRGAKSTVLKLENKENVGFKLNATVSEIVGDKKVESIILSTGEKLDVSGVFVAVGMIPQTDLLKELAVVTPEGYVKAGEDCKTDIEGLFVAGDARTKTLRQVITAASDGANAVMSAIEYLR